MKTKLKKELTLGEFITTAYRIWGARQAEKMVRWVIDARLVVLKTQPPYSIASSKGHST